MTKKFCTAAAAVFALLAFTAPVPVVAGIWPLSGFDGPALGWENDLKTPFVWCWAEQA